MGVADTLRYIVNHPLNRDRRVRAIAGYVTWQLRSRLRHRPLIVHWIGGTRLLVSRGMTGATGNIYTGLHEFPEMSFLLHLLRSGDLFVDAGANVGSYTVLASGCSGAHVVSIEPSSAAFAALLANIELNGVTALVEPSRIALGKQEGNVPFTVGLDSVNHVVASRHPEPRRLRRIASHLEILRYAQDDVEQVSMTTLDRLLRGRAATLIKMDVEGYETEVVDGAVETLRSKETLAVIMELNGEGKRYGYDDADLHRRMQSFGFRASAYDPFNRSLVPTDKAGSVGDTIYISDFDRVNARVKSAPSFHVYGQSI